MKQKIAFLITLLFCAFSTFAQIKKSDSTIYINKQINQNRHPFYIRQPVAMQVINGILQDVCKNNVILKGVNVDVYKSTWENNWQLDEIAKTSANAVRINWWANWKSDTGPFPYSLGNLENAILKCQQLNMVPIVELHDVTCKDNNDADFENIVMKFWLSTGVINLINKYQNCLVINIANEFGKVEWADDQSVGWPTYAAKYKNAIVRLRAKGVKVPIMIDAPDCGTSSQVFIDHSTEILNYDGLKNIIFSLHTYWNSLTTAQITTQITAMKNTNNCFVLGEIANIQGDDSIVANDIDLYANGKMEKTAIEAKKNNIGFLWWLWWNDGVAQRQLSKDGKYNNLTPQGTRALKPGNAYNFLSETIKKPMLGCK